MIIYGYKKNRIMCREVIQNLLLNALLVETYTDSKYRLASVGKSWIYDQI